MKTEEDTPENWKKVFAWLPTKTENGTVVWLESLYKNEVDDFPRPIVTYRSKWEQKMVGIVDNNMDEAVEEFLADENYPLTEGKTKNRRRPGSNPPPPLRPMRPPPPPMPPPGRRVGGKETINKTTKVCSDCGTTDCIKEVPLHTTVVGRRYRKVSELLRCCKVRQRLLAMHKHNIGKKTRGTGPL